MWESIDWQYMTEESVLEDKSILYIHSYGDLKVLNIFLNNFILLLCV